MEILHAPATLSAFLLVLFSVLWWCWWRTDTKRPLPPPEPSGSWPVIGHLRFLGASDLSHITLSNLADKYGPIFMVKLGVNQVLVISNKDMARECLADNEGVFLNRPHTAAVEHMAYRGATVGFSPYGSYWREMRKLVMLELHASHRLERLKHLRTSEVRSAIKSVHERISCSESGVSSTSNGITIDISRWFEDINLNVMARLLAGKDFEDDEYDRYHKAVREFFHMFGAFVISDIFPFLRWLDIGGCEKAMKRTARELDNLIQGWLDEHKRERDSTPDHEGARKSDKDFIDVMLDKFGQTVHEKSSDFDSDTAIKATCLAMTLAGTDGQSATLTWALSLLLNKRSALKKVQDELDIHVGKERLVDESDMKNLIYLQVVVKETLRLYPPVPLSAPREAVTDCIVGGYHVPARTRLFVNLYKIHRDPQMWQDPCEFHPERFMTTHENVDLKGNNFELIPFGSGKRVCPGISFALQIIQFTLASLLQGFEITTPVDGRIDMAESLGFNNVKANPLDAILTPRLPNHLYGER
ncbi:hypothetical protein Ancab_040060 [Ancistrocladus abbreviatus]